MGPTPALGLIMLFVAAVSSIADGGKVLVFGVEGSHWLKMKILVEALHSRGHDITVIRTSTSWYIKDSSPHYTSITITLEQGQNIESQSLMSNFLKRSLDFQKSNGSPWALLAYYHNTFNLLQKDEEVTAKVAATILENKTLVKELKHNKFDLLLTDPCLPGGVLLAHYLQCPMVLVGRWFFSGEAHFAIAPSPLSYIPQLFSKLTDKMDFFQRVKNILHHGLMLYMYYYVTNPPYQAVCDHYFGPDTNVMSLIQGADIFLISADFTFEFPHPTMPNVVYIGGFHCRPPKPLPSHLEEFVQSSGDHGVIIMTLGTLLGDLGPEISEIFASAFASLPQKVLWRHTGKRPVTLGNNTMLVDWLPQNDLLGHPKTRILVSHGGTNGLYEAIYHGVPVLGVPLIFDQHDNMVRMTAREVAEVVDVTNLDVESLTKALKNLLDLEKPYRENMQKLSQIHRDKPLKPIDSATFWMEYVMRHKGAPHLRTESYKLPWYTYHSLDVIAFFLGCGLLIVILIVTSCGCLFRCFSNTKNFKSKSKRE
ncbi:UDP-glucuronosyltransferase 2C1-like [Thalassophryne amazonica]|uniref:UDP-glucuronosyltransferase 2C1-like n=1 Tax=Thalassophryne amazonica TaxID=390379 RepID=UPI001470C6FC|nr:UDP-glucuronosyltransferase 2C1-like [Thalassophryne amazonica]